MISLELHFRRRLVPEGQGGNGRNPDLLCLGENGDSGRQSVWDRNQIVLPALPWEDDHLPR